MLRLHIVEARELIKADVGVLGMGKSDPYCIISGMCIFCFLIYLHIYIAFFPLSTKGHCGNNLKLVNKKSHLYSTK